MNIIIHLTVFIDVTQIYLCMFIYWTLKENEFFMNNSCRGGLKIPPVYLDSLVDNKRCGKYNPIYPEENWKLKTYVRTKQS